MHRIRGGLIDVDIEIPPEPDDTQVEEMLECIGRHQSAQWRSLHFFTLGRRPVRWPTITEGGFEALEKAVVLTYCSILMRRLNSTATKLLLLELRYPLIDLKQSQGAAWCRSLQSLHLLGQIDSIASLSFLLASCTSLTALEWDASKMAETDHPSWPPSCPRLQSLTLTFGRRGWRLLSGFQVTRLTLEWRQDSTVFSMDPPPRDVSLPRLIHLECIDHHSLLIAGRLFDAPALLDLNVREDDFNGGATTGGWLETWWWDQWELPARRLKVNRAGSSRTLLPIILSKLQNAEVLVFKFYDISDWSVFLPTDIWCPSLNPDTLICPNLRSVQCIMEKSLDCDTSNELYQVLSDIIVSRRAQRVAIGIWEVQWERRAPLKGSYELDIVICPEQPLMTDIAMVTVADADGIRNIGVGAV
jgi:hypothetical protein